jgi:hypothetical protein
MAPAMAAIAIDFSLRHGARSRTGGNTTCPSPSPRQPLNTQDDLDANVIDEFRKSSAMLDALIFHDAVNPMGGGSTLTYGYHRLVSQRDRRLPSHQLGVHAEEATKQRYTVDLKPLGGSFQIDRVLAGIARGAEVTLPDAAADQGDPHRSSPTR